MEHTKENDVGARLTELETRAAFQDDTVARLNEVIIAQEQRIARLERDIALLKSQLELVAPSLIADARDEKPPPHY